MAVLIVNPFLQKENDSIGLSEYGFQAFPGSKTYLEVPVIYGKYLTGFDVDAFYLDKLDEKAKDKEIKAIKKKVDELNKKFSSVTELSMGMTNDYKIAIEEGATFLRIGSAIFGERNY